jgi:heme O synthase-like polyprenyltransferase
MEQVDYIDIFLTSGLVFFSLYFFYSWKTNKFDDARKYFINSIPILCVILVFHLEDFFELPLALDLTITLVGTVVIMFSFYRTYK